MLLQKAGGAGFRNHRVSGSGRSSGGRRLAIDHSAHDSTTKSSTHCLTPWPGRFYVGGGSDARGAPARERGLENSPRPPARRHANTRETGSSNLDGPLRWHDSRQDRAAGPGALGPTQRASCTWSAVILIVRRGRRTSRPTCIETPRGAVWKRELVGTIALAWPWTGTAPSPGNANRR